ncbi:hypothetical protein GGX14DRAFT_32173 [Mycena pura]|uniref:Uncharacterized protein n=1 Tax=Mycena pura TaxID=153505 RepID=A0AAD6Y531_9AGAR|nr:hypothetical protein GGX14DRAFT_32173 [Mycena pura]
MIALSACPRKFRNSLVALIGLLPDYTLYNEGNFRSELSTIILPMKNDASSFLDISFLLKLG